MKTFKAASAGAFWAFVLCICGVGLGTSIYVAMRVLPAVCK